LAVPVLLAIAARTNFSKAVPLTPVLGNYPDASLSLSTDTTVTPDAPPMNTTRINVSTSTNFKFNKRAETPEKRNASLGV
jgi:hypothetical protein